MIIVPRLVSVMLRGGIRRFALTRASTRLCLLAPATFVRNSSSGSNRAIGVTPAACPVTLVENAIASRYINILRVFARQRVQSFHEAKQRR